jgi:Fe-S-cluster containining protein
MEPRVKLPLVDPATDACRGCVTACCMEHEVEVNGFDLLRLLRGLGLPWDAVARIEGQASPMFFGFRLDSGPTHFHFFLRRRPSGACQFLLELDGGHRRCGVHALRPGACRIYPLLASEGGSIVGSHVLCPPERRAMYEAARPSLQSLVDDDKAAQSRWALAIEAWDQTARTVPRESPLSPADLLAWLEEFPT